MTQFLFTVIDLFLGTKVIKSLSRKVHKNNDLSTMTDKSNLQPLSNPFFFSRYFIKSDYYER